ncbi:MAG: MFS transporter [Gammaproteobacteria bacterium]|nr:MFS transporter [Gammaproteobacteria bacterium]
MNPTERRIALCLASVYGLRMLGLFMIVPIFTLYAQHLTGSTPFFVGLTIGIYGLMQVLLQIPFGILSDHIGRKTVIVLGLLLFVVGSLVAAKSTTIFGVMAGRALQGSGAISSALLALTSDLIRDEVRTRGLAIIGFSMGASFALALILGPFLNSWIGGDGLFWICAGLGMIALFVVGGIIPSHSAIRDTLAQAEKILPQEPLKDSWTQSAENPIPLGWLYAGIFILHFILVAIFLSVPLLLSRMVGENTLTHSGIYALVLVLSFMGAFLLIRKGERKAPLQKTLQIGALGLVIGLLCLWQGSHSLPLFIFGLLIFFLAFNILEASFPSLLSQQAPQTEKGKIFGVYSTAQFLGAFAGGALGGWLSEHLGIQAVLGFSVGAAGLAYLITIKIRNSRIENNTLQKQGDITWQEESIK